MSLKDALRLRTRAVQKRSRRTNYLVQINFQVVSARHFFEIVSADNEKEAHKKAREQFSHLSAEYLFHQSKYPLRKIFEVQRVDTHIVHRRKQVSLTDSQRRVLQELSDPGKYLVHSYGGRWRIHDTTYVGRYSYKAYEYVSPVTTNVLFEKGLLIPVAVKNLDAKEIMAQKAVGAIGDLLSKFTVNTVRLEELGIKLVKNEQKNQ